MIQWAYRRGWLAHQRCIGDHTGIAGNPTNASQGVRESYLQGYFDSKNNRRRWA